MSNRPLRQCDVCRGIDDHPRHVQQTGGQLRIRHMDCCAAQGCEVCKTTEADNAGRRGQELIDHLAQAREG